MINTRTAAELYIAAIAAQNQEQLTAEQRVTVKQIILDAEAELDRHDVDREDANGERVTGISPGRELYVKMALRAAIRKRRVRREEWATLQVTPGM